MRLLRAVLILVVLLSVTWLARYSQPTCVDTVCYRTDRWTGKVVVGAYVYEAQAAVRQAKEARQAQQQRRLAQEQRRLKECMDSVRATWASGPDTVPADAPYAAAISQLICEGRL